MKNASHKMCCLKQWSEKNDSKSAKSFSDVLFYTNFFTVTYLHKLLIVNTVLGKKKFE